MAFRPTIISLAMGWLSLVAIGNVRCQDVKDAKPLEQQLPHIAPKAPGEALQTFRTLPGFRMELLAAEPLVTDPVAMVYDENGVAYVAEMRDYPYTDKTTDVPFKDRTTDEPIGRVRVLIDHNGDGGFDESHIFADELSWPTGLALFQGGVFVGATPDIWYLKDTDGDFKADVRRKVYTGFRKFNVQAVMNNLAWGIDHKIYGAASGNGGTITMPGDPKVKPIAVSRRDFRFDPNNEAFEVISGGARFGNTFDDWYDRFICNIRNPVQHVVLPSRYLARNPYLPVPSALYDAAKSGDQLPVYRTSPPEPWRMVRAKRWAVATDRKYPRSETVGVGFFTSSSGITIYRGSAYPKEFYGNAVLGEVAGNLVHRQRLERDGVTFRAERADRKIEFLTSTDNWFRPVNYVNAPDGTLHLLDMYRETIEHPWSIPDDIKEHLDLESGRDRGRIYRLAYGDFEPSATPKLGTATTDELIRALESPNAWWRETAHRLIFERQDASAVPGLRSLLQKGTSPLARLHAMWSLAGLNQLSNQDLAGGLDDASWGVRMHAVRLAEPRLEDDTNLFERALELAGDDSARVRMQVAFSLGEVDDPRVPAALTEIARRDAADVWIRTAVLSSATTISAQVLTDLVNDAEFIADDAGKDFLRSLAQVVGTRKNSEEIRRVLDVVTTVPPKFASARLQVVAGLGDGLRRGRSSLAEVTGKSTAQTKDMIEKLLGEAKGLAVDAKQRVADRVDATELLGHAKFEVVGETLAGLLDAREPQRVQLAALRTLAGLNTDAVAQIITDAWPVLTPSVREEAVSALFARRGRIAAFLNAVESEKIPAGQIALTRKNLLMKHRDAAVRQRAIALFAKDAPGPRKAVVADYQNALSLTGRLASGRKVFEKECLTCHKLGDKGHDVGPNLLTVQNRSREEIMLHLLDPNREVSPDFLEYTIVLDDGRIVTGIIASETATSIAVKRAENVKETILRSNIEQMTSTGKSLMPEGLEKKIDHQQMADLLSFLLSLRTPAK